MVGFQPAGDWYEGPTYWAYGATYNAMLDRHRVLVEDKITGVPVGQEIRWGMITPATVALNGNKARLTQNGSSSAEDATVRIESHTGEKAPPQLIVQGRTR